MEAYQKRVVAEKEALCKDIALLAVFCSGEIFDGLGKTERRLLNQQLLAMTVYRDILSERIALF